MKRNTGFTLIEIAIVLLVVGLLAGGIAVGKDLVRSATLKSVIRDQQQYKSAINAFKTTYDAYPGDLSNANSFWTGGLSGDGDNLIEFSNSEHVKAWQHLSLSGLINGSYNGTTETGASKMGGTSRWNIESVTAAIYNVPAYSKPVLAMYTTSGWANVISPVDAYEIDKKIDDGVPSRGDVFALYMPASGAGTNCAINTTTNLTANYTTYTGITTYNLTQTTKTCVMFFYGF